VEQLRCATLLRVLTGRLERRTGESAGEEDCPERRTGQERRSCCKRSAPLSESPSCAESPLVARLLLSVRIVRPVRPSLCEWSLSWAHRGDVSAHYLRLQWQGRDFTIGRRLGPPQPLSVCLSVCLSQQPPTHRFSFCPLFVIRTRRPPSLRHAFAGSPPGPPHPLSLLALCRIVPRRRRARRLGRALLLPPGARRRMRRQGATARAAQKAGRRARRWREGGGKKGERGTMSAFRRKGVARERHSLLLCRVSKEAEEE
jgi:hypothetical protein